MAKRRLARRRPRADRDRLRGVLTRLDRLSQHVAQLETLARGNARVLLLQFRRMAMMQAELDQLTAERRRRRIAS